MFKISKLSLMILGVGVMIIAFVALYLSYSQSTSQRDTLLKSIDTAQVRLAQIGADRRTTEPKLTQLQQQISDLNSAYNQSAGQFPVMPIQSIEYDNELSNLAEQCGLTLNSLTATDSSVQQDGNFTYIITDFTVQVAGDRTNLLDFIHRVSQSDYFTTASVNSVDLKEQATPTPTATPTSEVPPPVNYYTVDMTITVYRYGGN